MPALVVGSIASADARSVGDCGDLFGEVFASPRLFVLLIKPGVEPVLGKLSSSGGLMAE